MRTLLASALLVVLAGCGGGSDSDGPSTKDLVDSVAKAPPCSDVWAVGKTLPTEYENCIGSDGAIVLDAYYDCADGSELTTHDEKFVAIVGGKIEAYTEASYSAAFDACNPS